MVSTREQLHQLVDRIPDSDLLAAKRALERLTYRSALAEFLDSAELDDEPTSPEEEAAIAQFDQALALYESKDNGPSAARARGLLSPQPAME